VKEFRTVRGFEEVWRPPSGARRVRLEAPGPSWWAGYDLRERLARLARGAPEVVVKVTGRTRDPVHLRSHLEYLTRNGQLVVLTRNGVEVCGRQEVRELAEGWSAVDLLDPRRRANSPMSVGVVLSMPRRTDPLRLTAAAAAFAEQAFEGHDYVLVLHTDADHPHVHVAVRARGDDGRRLNPRKADLEAWRQMFAQALRDRGVDAEATPRRARGVTRKAERTPLRKIRERFEAGAGPLPARLRSALVDAAGAMGGGAGLEAWDRAIQARQQVVRRLYLAQARLLQASEDPGDRRLGRDVERFVREMPAPDSRRLVLARALRAAQERAAARQGMER
jgi:hypothetical protein